MTALMDIGKFLMAAKTCRRGAHREYIISLDVEDMSQGGYSYLGKLRYFPLFLNLFIKVMSGLYV